MHTFLYILAFFKLYIRLFRLARLALSASFGKHRKTQTLIIIIYFLFFLFLKMTLLSSQVHEVTPPRGRTSVWHATPRPKDPPDPLRIARDPALFCQLVPESKPHSQRVPIFARWVALRSLLQIHTHRKPKRYFWFYFLIFLCLPPAGFEPTIFRIYARRAPYP